MDVSIEVMNTTHLDLISLDEFDDFWNMNILREELLSPTSSYFVALHDGDVCGFAGVNLILDEAHIANIAVKKDFRLNGIGTKLLETLIDFSKTCASSITLEVNTENSIAIHLYEKYGFKNLGRRKKYYNNKFDAYIMTKIF